MNSFTIIGRIKNVSITKDYADVTIGIYRPYKNAEGIYEEDIISTRILGTTHPLTAELLVKGTLIGVSGRIQSNDKGDMILLAHKVTFLGDTQKEEE
jgi:single-stranded DNA-binding protein